MEQMDIASIECRAPDGSRIATVTLTPDMHDGGRVELAPIIRLAPEVAAEHGETEFQLLENGRYYYDLDRGGDDRDLRLRCHLARRRPKLGAGAADEGRLETGGYCGTLLLEIVEGDAADHAQPPLATALVDVRSIKLHYRSEYRGMLRSLANRMADLVADSSSSAKTSFRSTFEERNEHGWFQVQLELLREMLESVEFAAALQRILSFPHEQLEQELEQIPVERPFKWTAKAVHALVTSPVRCRLPAGHPLRAVGLDSVAARVPVVRKTPTVDTPENRFIKHALRDFHAFVSRAETLFKDADGDWSAAAEVARRLSLNLEQWLSRPFFKEVDDLVVVPLGSPVLQRKAGYREVLRWWLRFRTAAELSWAGGEDMFHAGQRNVAELYEYWLFFQLLDWFCRKCGQGKPPIGELIDGLDGDSPSLKLKKRQQLGPFAGAFAGQSRRLNARFAYNRSFVVTTDHAVSGSWTRRLHPDYTFTFWPEELSEAEAERREMLVHVHFDAKYRVENIEALFGAEGGDDADDEGEGGNYKRQDLLKMHAYRDAIKRSQGAYVLYPGRAAAPVTFQGFHEILPGLGAFGVASDEHGEAQGLGALETFLEEILAHLGNRTTTQEQVSYHISEAYAFKEEPVAYGSLRLPEQDIYGTGHPALPPAEHMVLVAWYRDQAQLDWTRASGKAIVRLGRRPGAWHVQPEFAEARHLLLHSRGGVSPPGLWKLRSPGYRVFTDTELKATGYPGLAGGEIYALFEVEPDQDWTVVNWHRKRLIRAIRDFESRIRHRLVVNIGRRSAFPRILPLKDLLRAKL